MIPANDALTRLIDGNRRYVTDTRHGSSASFESRRNELVGGQAPFAVILGCSDSRVPAELVFDQGLGDLFVVRVAGNIAAPSQVGSIEYAVQVLGARLVVVLGHSKCGAVEATLADIREPGEFSPDLRSIIDHIRPNIKPVVDADNSNADGNTLSQQAVRANVQAGANHLRHESAPLNALIHEDGLMIVGAEYALETGEVAFFDIPNASENA